MTQPIKAIVISKCMVFVCDFADICTLKAMCPDEETAGWVADALGRAHAVPVTKANPGDFRVAL